jgi:small redox-active disulfide protein 2
MIRLQDQNPGSRTLKLETRMLTIKILGAGCANCKRVEQIARKVVGELAVEAEFVKITDYGEIMDYDILATPGLVIEDQVVCAGRIPSRDEIANWVMEAAAAAAA